MSKQFRNVRFGLVRRERSDRSARPHRGYPASAPVRAVSDANRYAIETVGDPRYPLDLFLRVITVSLETNEIVKSLPELWLE